MGWFEQLRWIRVVIWIKWISFCIWTNLIREMNKRKKSRQPQERCITYCFNLLPSPVTISCWYSNIITIITCCCCIRISYLYTTTTCCCCWYWRCCWWWWWQLGGEGRRRVRWSIEKNKELVDTILNSTYCTSIIHGIVSYIMPCMVSDDTIIIIIISCCCCCCYSCAVSYLYHHIVSIHTDIVLLFRIQSSFRSFSYYLTRIFTYIIHSLLFVCPVFCVTGHTICFTGHTTVHCYGSSFQFKTIHLEIMLYFTPYLIRWNCT